MSNRAEEDVRAALRRRLGKGARYDAPLAPARELAWARRGTAYFARKLNDIKDEELDAPSLVERWTRRHVVAHVGYHARALAYLVESVRTGIEIPVHASLGGRRAEIDLGATLPPQALRNLFEHTEVHLDVEWRDLADERWSAFVHDTEGRTIPISKTPWIRCRAIWLHAVDLANGGSFFDFPPELLDTLIVEFAQGLAHLDLILSPVDRSEAVRIGSGIGPTIVGMSADIARWLSGRGARRLYSSREWLPEIPPLRC